VINYRNLEGLGRLQYKYLRNGARYEKGYYDGLTGSRICAFDWYQKKSSTLDDLEQPICTPLQQRCIFYSALQKFEWR